MIDWDRVQNLRHEVGADAFPEVVALFFDECGEVAERLRHARRASAAVAADLHLLRGSALNFGFDALAALCESAEVSLARGEAASTDPVLRCFELSREAFAARLGTSA